MSEKSLRKFCYLALLLTLAAMIYINGCHESSPTHPTEAGNEEGGLALKIFADPETRAKLTGLTLDVVGLNDAGQPAEPRMSINVPSLDLPVTVPLTLYDPPCRYQVTVTAALSREAPRVATRVLDVCSESRLTIKIDTFEGFFIAVNPLKAPEAVNAGAAADVSCGTNQIDAPDKAQYPLSATLSEQDGSAISGAFDVNVAVAGSFPDPYPLSSPITERHFTCEVTDGRSAPQTFAIIVKRIVPTPTPTPTPTAAPTEQPAAPTAPPIIPPASPSCVVTNANDSGVGSLREILTDAACPTITFAPGVTTITLAGTELTVARNVTIDGGSGVTISGNNASRVFSVSSGVTATFAGLTISGGNASGVLNNGVLTLESSTTISNNTNDMGGGLFNGFTGTAIVNGVISNNTARMYGGGIYNFPEGKVTINGIVRQNTSDDYSGGIGNGGTVVVNGEVIGNTAEVMGGIGNESSGTAIINGTVSGNTAILEWDLVDSGKCGGIGNNGTLIVTGTIRNNRAARHGGGICIFEGTVTLNSGHVIEGNHAVNSDIIGYGWGGGIFDFYGNCPTNANYGAGNYRGSGTTTIDNCQNTPYN